MANWAWVGIDIRGTKEDLLRFLKEEVTWAIQKRGLPEPAEVVEPLFLEEGDKLHIMDGYNPIYGYDMHLRSSHRHFATIESPLTTSLIGSTTETGEIYEIYFSLEVAWGPDRDYFKVMAEKYNLAFTVESEETGMCYHGYGIIDKENDTYEEYDLDEWRSTVRYELFPDTDFSSDEAEEAAERAEMEDEEDEE